MEATTETTTVERELAIAASPETVWEFLVDPEKAVRWMGMKATLEAQPGGLYYCEVIPGHTAKGEFIEVDRPNRLVYTWGWETTSQDNAIAPGSTRIEIELLAEGDGTMLKFRHDLPTAAAAESHAHGWDHYLGRLVTAAGGADPGEDPWIKGEM
jgi:uncharacterized protein YndB with AHSA1/START domain